MADQVYVKSGKTFHYQSIADNLVGRGAYGRVFAGRFKPNLDTSWGKGSGEGKQAAIKRVEINFKEECRDIKNDREVVALKELRHPCIVRLFAVEDDDNFRNFVFEMCQATLEDFITKKYDGLMPDEIKGLYQMACGLKFIHEKKMIHRDIKPENVLVYLPKNVGQRAMLKISDLGFTKPLNEDGIHYDLASGLKGTEYYLAPELLALRNLTGRVLDKECTIATDVFAAGCTFFRYLNGGLHPFGKGFNIEVNIMDGNPVNATKYGGEPWKTDLIAEMVKLNPKERPSFSKIVEGFAKHVNATLRSWSHFSSVSGEESLSPVIIVEQNENYDKTRRSNVGDVQFDRRNKIGEGGFGTVFAGTFKGEKVAVKRVDPMASLKLRENDLERSIKFHQLLNHPNIVQFKHCEEDLDFRYIVLELCAATLEDFIKGKYEGPMPTDEQVLFQLANGLEHIHSRKILHRNIKPEIILISLTKPVEMKWSVFGLSKSLNEKRTFPISGMRGNQSWMSPEEMRMLQSEENADHTRPWRGSVKSDIFSAGCVFMYFLLRGLHPFGKSLEISINISEGRPVNEIPEEHFARPFVRQMIENDPEKRISLSKVIEHLTPIQPPNRLSLLQYDSKNLLCSTGTLSLVYHVGTFGGSPLAVKRVPLQDCTTKSFEELIELNHSNIIRLLYFDEDTYHRYFGMELCVASLDQLFLPEDDPKKYKGPISSDDQFGFQLISGLEYIHGKNLVHGSIKPTNVLISSSQDPQIKLSDFGLTASRLDDGHTTKRVISGFLSSRYWLAPELLLTAESGDRQFTKESDVFAAGSVFFYFLSRGCHLFGDIHEIIPNTLKGIPKNDLETQTQIGYFSIIRWMTTVEPERRSILSEVTEQMKLLQPPPSINSVDKLKKIGEIQFSRSHKIGEGGQASVFLGFSKGSAVAVKRITIDTVEKDKKSIVYRERDSFQKLKHRNIVKFIDCGENSTFMVLAVEKCLTSLDNYCRKLQVCRIILMPSDQEVLLQMAQGLEYIHSQRLIHRDVKPANILISHDNPAVIKWADFGLSRAVVTGSKTFSWSKLQGTDRWLAPELITATQENKIKGSQKCDIFALGCVFFFFLVPGVHPFGEGDVFYTHTNIKAKNPLNLNRLPRQHFAFYIINGMIENDTGLRLKLPDVVQKLSICTRTIEDDAEETQPPVKKPKKDDD